MQFPSKLMFYRHDIIIIIVLCGYYLRPDVAIHQFCIMLEEDFKRQLDFIFDPRYYWIWLSLSRCLIIYIMHIHLVIRAPVFGCNFTESFQYNIIILTIPHVRGRIIHTVSLIRVAIVAQPVVKILSWRLLKLFPAWSEFKPPFKQVIEHAHLKSVDNKRVANWVAAMFRQKNSSVFF